MYEDKTLQCRECNQEFIFSAGEQEFYQQKGLLNEPGRCPTCRQNRRVSMNSSSGATALTVACVPTGMNTGVWIAPCGVWSRPARAALPAARATISNRSGSSSASAATLPGRCSVTAVILLACRPAIADHMPWSMRSCAFPDIVPPRSNPADLAKTELAGIALTRRIVYPLLGVPLASWGVPGR